MPAFTSATIIGRLLPFLPWLKGYSARYLRLDLTAGLTVAMVLIPQSMAYARLADLPAYYGLYAALLPPLVAALFGSSQQLATGPVAIVSLMTAASLEPLATAGSEAFIAYAVLLALVVGVFQLLLGVLRLGLVVNFLSHPVVNGFTNAAAIIIASSQLSKIFGVYVDKAEHHYETIWRVLMAAVHYTHWPTFAMAAGAFALMWGLKRLSPKIPSVLVAVALATLISWLSGFQHDARVPLANLAEHRIRQEIKDYNQAVQKIEALGNVRAELNLKIRDVNHKPHQEDDLTTLRLEQEAVLDTAMIHREKRKAHLLREKLRDYIFIGTEGSDGLLRFHLGSPPTPRDEGDKRLWRLSVGERRLDEGSLKMTGGGAVVGEIPPGLPTFGPPRPDVSIILQLIPYAVIISFLGFMEAVAIAKAMAAKTGQRLDLNQELIGQGLGNIAGSFSGGYPVSGSFSRSAVNLQSGARTFMSSVFTSLAVALALIFFTPLLYHLPLSVLAAVIMLAVVGLVNISGIVHAWRAQKHDGIIAVVTFAATLLFAPELDYGILIGAGLSLLVFLYKSMRPRVALLALGEDKAFHDAPDHGLDLCDRIAVIRFDGPLFYANAAFLEDKIAEQRRKMPNLRHILLVCEGINEMDASGEESLSLVVDRVRSAGHRISLAGVHLNVLKTMERTHLLAKIGPENIYPTVADAVAVIHRDAHRDLDEGTVCPLQSMCPLGSAREEAGPSGEEGQG